MLASDGTTSTRDCIGDQINWPRPALASDPVDNSVAFATSVYCPSPLCSPAGNRIGYGQTIPMGCSVSGGGFGTEGSGQNPSPCVNSNDVPCTCNSGGSCGTTPPTYETDQILPELAYNSANDLALTYYDNSGRASTASISAFGDVLGQASAGTNAHLISHLQTGFQVIQPFSQEVDASAVAQRLIGLAPRNEATPFYGASIGGKFVFNQQFNSQ
jgi:hypothetical protein